MRKLWNLVRSGKEVRSNLLLTAVIASTAVLAFCWGRHGTVSVATAQGVNRGDPAASRGQESDYARRVVAFIHGNIPITREELGEYLIARFGPERLEFLVNRRIIEQACRARNITVSDAEVDAQLKLDLQGFNNISEKDFVDKILKRYNKTLYEWREDVIRPRLALTKFCKEKVVVTDADVQKRFEQLHGEKVKCRMIVLQKDFRQSGDLWAKISSSEEEFDKEAKKQFIPQLRETGGEIPPITQHFGDEKIEKAAFSLKTKGEVTPRLQMPDGTVVILKMVERIPPDTSKKLEVERIILSREVAEIKLNQEIPKFFADLRDKAHPTILLRRELGAAEQDRQVQEQLRGTPGLPMPPSAPRGN